MSNTLKLGNGQWATGKDTVLAYNDLNSNYKPLAFSFSRDTSATVVNKDGLIETVGSGEPRIDFKDNTKGALLLEPQRTNYVLKSNDFSLLSGGFVTPNYGTSPEGLSVSRILFTDANQSMSSGTSLSTGVVCNFSAYVKGIKGQFIKFAAGGVDIAHTFSGEWERLSGSATSINNSWNLNTYGYATARDFLLCGVQLEQGSYATSYIPTSGQANGVTRVTDALPITELRSKNILGSVAFSYLFDFTHQGGGTFSGFFNEVENNSNYKGGWVYSSGLQYRTPIGGGNFYVNVKVPITSGDRVKCCVTLNGSTRKIYANGVLISTLNNCDNLSNDIDGFIQYYGNTNANYESWRYNGLQVYNTELTNAEAIALTTI